MKRLQDSLAQWLALFALGLALPAAADNLPAAAEPYRLLITLHNDSHQEAKVFQGFSRNYRASKSYDGTLQVKNQVTAIAKQYHLQEADGWQINSLGVYCALLVIPDGRNLDAVVKQLTQDRRIETVQPLLDYAVQTTGSPAKTDHAASDAFYNDPYFDLQYAKHTELISRLHRDATGRGINIAVVDTGADTHHPDLSGQIRTTRNFVDENKARFIADIHGTAVSGIIAAKPNNGLGIVGLAPDANTWVLKACWQLAHDNSAARCNSFTLANAISYAIDHQAHILNVSLAGPKDPLVGRLIDKAIANGMTVVASDPVIGNHRYPALQPGVIAVRQQGEPSSNSNGNLSIHLNGTDILSTGPGGNFDFFSGSSMSTALISGLSALVIEQYQTLAAEPLLEMVAQLSNLNKNDPQRTALERDKSDNKQPIY